MNKQGANTAIFSPVSGKAWKQRIQYELDGADYNEQMLRESSDGIKTKPFYTREDLPENFSPNTQENQPFHIGIEVFVALEALRENKTVREPRLCRSQGCSRDRGQVAAAPNAGERVDMAGDRRHGRGVLGQGQKG